MSVITGQPPVARSAGFSNSRMDSTQDAFSAGTPKSLPGGPFTGKIATEAVTGRSLTDVQELSARHSKNPALIEPGHLLLFLYAILDPVSIFASDRMDPLSDSLIARVILSLENLIIALAGNRVPTGALGEIWSRIWPGAQFLDTYRDSHPNIPFLSR
ncbi:hypothetical protein C8R44DRAFT_739831 [Mycena epipterygia]|nr:hypothetical protein C8R44DRAFT_739831 [Mycena epipterygia]